MFWACSIVPFSGSMFLVRMQVSTASGGPVRDARVRVGIKALKAMAPGSTSPNLLQSLATAGNSLGTVADQNMELDPLTTVRVSNGAGTIDFPLTVIRASSGTYQLQFQPDVPDAKIVLETSAFKVENAISVNSTEAFSQIEIKEYGKRVKIPKAPEFCIESASGETLAELQSQGIKISLTLTLKGAPTDKESMASRLVREAKLAKAEAARNAANAMALRFTETPNAALKRAVDVMVASINSKRKGAILCPKSLGFCTSKKWVESFFLIHLCFGVLVQRVWDRYGLCQWSIIRCCHPQESSPDSLKSLRKLATTRLPGCCKLETQQWS